MSPISQGSKKDRYEVLKSREQTGTKQSVAGEVRGSTPRGKSLQAKTQRWERINIACGKHTRGAIVQDKQLPTSLTS